MTKYFMLKIFSCFVCYFGVSGGSKPVLNVGEEEVFSIEQNETAQHQKPLIVQCVGDSKLTWHTKVSDEYYKVTHNVTDGKHYSTLNIWEPYFEDTGFFNCSDEQQEMASSYIYVYDGKHGFSSGSPKTIDVTIGNSIVLDCKTTHPDINVTVWKDKIGDITSRFEWSKYLGFTKTAESLQETGLYTCKEDRFTSNITRVIKIYPTRILQSPSIATFRNSHYVVGHEFSLDCKIPAELGNEPVFKWTTPREDGSTENTGMNSAGNLSYSKLTVTNPTLADTGVYKCTVYQGKESAEDSIHITVVENIEPYVRFNTSESNQKGLFVREGDPFKWVLYFRGFPDTLQYEFSDPFGRAITEKPNKASITYNYEEGMLQLLLHDIQARNFGNYSAVLRTTNGMHDSTSVVLLVNATPKVEFEAMPDLFHINYEARVKASILAFDISQRRPDVSWTFFSDCPRGVGSCDMTKGQELSHLLEKDIPINHLKSTTVQFFPAASGVVECRVKNSYGVNSTTANVFVSDKNDSLSATVTTEEGATVLGRGSTSDIAFVEGDNVTLECFMLDFIFEDLTFRKKANKQNTYSCNTDLSTGKCVDLPYASQEDSVQFACGASNRITKEKEEIKFRLIFVEKMSPFILPESNVSMEGTTLSVNLSDAFKIFCLVDGRPVPKITWFKDGENIEEIPNYVDEKKIFLHKEKQILEFKFAQTEHAGEYMCHVENRVGFIEPFTTVTVEGTGLAGAYWVLIAFAIAFIVILILIVVGLAFRVKREGKLRDDLRRNQLYLFEKGNIGDLNKECTIDEQADLLPYDRSFEVEKKRIKLGKLLGAGAFGRVMEADVEDLEKEGQTTRVAVKMCKDGSDIAHLRALTLELKIMVHLGKHLNIVNLMGAHTENMKTGDLWILVEYCKYGNLLKFIQKCRSRFINQIDPVTGTIDSSRMSPSPSDSVSQGTFGKQHAPSRGTSVDADGYLETRSQMGSLKAVRPLARRNSSNASHPDPSSATSRPGLYVGNPHYTTVGVLPERSEGLGPPSPLLPVEQGMTTPIVGATDQQHYMTLGQMPPHITSPSHTSVTSNQGSESSYHMNAQTEITGLSSPPPFSPTSSTSGDFFVDSHGNPVTSDSAGVPGISGPLTTTDLVCWAWQVAQGMEYLTKRKVLHGDLAARNLLLAERNVVKISDFGLSREMYKNDIYMKKGDEIMPIKWMAPEAIQQKVFSIQSDVWAFGITLWEMFTLGNTPYPGVPLNQEFTIALENGMRMDKPKFCNDELYDLMHECWHLDPLERPSFTRIAEQLSEMLSPEYRDNYVAMNTVYARKNEEWLEFKEDYLTMVTSPDFRNLHQPLLSDAQMDPSYIPMQGVSSIDSEGGVPVGGYLDMSSVKDSDSIFSPRPPSEGTQPPSVFTFSETETALSEDLQSPLETSNLLDTSKQKSDTASTSPNINNNNNINKINMLNQHPQQTPMYQNLDNFSPYKQKELESTEDKLIIDSTCPEGSGNYYVNLPKVNNANTVGILNI